MLQMTVVGFFVSSVSVTSLLRSWFLLSWVSQQCRCPLELTDPSSGVGLQHGHPTPLLPFGTSI